MLKKWMLILISLLLVSSYYLFSMDANVRVWGVDSPSRNRTLPIEITIGNNFSTTQNVDFSALGDYSTVVDLTNYSLNDQDMLTLTSAGRVIYSQKYLYNSCYQPFKQQHLY